MENYRADKESFDELNQFIADLEASLNDHDAVEYNKYFSSDISWGNSNGGLTLSLSGLHPVHKEFPEGPLKSRNLNIP